MRTHIQSNLAVSLLLVGSALCLLPWFSAALGLLLGVTIALTVGNPFPAQTKKLTQHLLSLSVMGLGFGTNLTVIGQVGLQGIGYTVIGIVLTLILGSLVGRWFGTEKDTSLLITVGTAICGGSAIAAVAPVIRAKSHEVTVALGTVFLLNAVALFLFPVIGHHLQVNETQFGLWSALAIHDTSSVVGATLQYGTHAVEVGTTVKLARALWIVPLALTIGFWRARQANENSERPTGFRKPWFIAGFIVAAALMTWLPVLRPAGHVIELIAKRTLVLTLFLIGAGLTRQTLRAVGVKPLLQGVVLWISVATLTLGAVLIGWIH